MELVFGSGLHVQIGVSVIQAHLDTVFHRSITSVGHGVFVRPLAHAAECQERLEAQRGGRMGFQQGVADEEAIAVCAEHHFLFQQNAADAINPCGNFFPFEADNILMPLGTVVVALVFVQTQIEFGSVLYHRFVERGE